MTWKKYVHQTLGSYCDAQGRSMLTLGEYFPAYAPCFAHFRPANHHRRRKVEQTLQFLRDDGVLRFVDNNGTYELVRPFIN